MRRLLMSTALVAAVLAAAACGPVGAEDPVASNAAGSEASLASAIAAPTRAPANVARDRYRHPAETLAFFGVRPTDTVVEIWPGGGWYTEILAPYLAPAGAYFAATPANNTNGMQRLIAARPDAYGKVRLATFPMVAGGTPVPPGTADVVLTFRNVHNWMEPENGLPLAPEAFRQMYTMLKPGGTLGVVDHRLPASADTARESSSGYLKVATVRALAERAGFRFVAASEVNANPKDTTDWPDGVWTLPPNLALKDKDREKYLAIGESDRMTLRFVKPS